MKSITLYLYFDGNCEEAFDFYEKVFDAKIVSLIKYSVLPESEGWPGTISEADKNRVENVVLRLSRNVYLQGADILTEQDLKVGNNMRIYLDLDTAEEARRIFGRLSQDGTLKMPLSQVHWDALFGICIDKYSIEWLVTCPDPEKQANDEL